MAFICGWCHQEHKVPTYEEDKTGMPCILALARERKELLLRIRAAEPVIGAARLMVQHQADRHELSSCCHDVTPTNAYLLKKALGEWDASQKQTCEHKWAHIEDHHVICEKCKHTADLCWTCEAEQTKTADGRLVCLKCHPQ